MVRPKNLKVFNRGGTSKRSWFTFKAAHEGQAEILIYDEIAWYAVDAQEFVGRLNALDVDRINIRLNTPGGSVFDGLAIYNALRAHKAEVHTHIDGVAASIGSVIALAGKERHIAQNAFMMIHDPWALTVGNAKELRDTANTLDKIGQSLETTYLDHSSMDQEDLRAAMEAETWYTAQEAFDVGFVTHIDGESSEQAKFDLSSYEHYPEQIHSGLKIPDNIKDFERLLRDAGFSRSDAKAISGNGFNELSQRDADPVDSEDEQLALLASSINLKHRSSYK